MTASLPTSPRRLHVRSRARTRSLAALVTGLALATTLTACGNDGGDDTASDPAASTGAPSESSATPSTTPTPSESPEPDSGSASGETIPATGSAGVTEAVVVSSTEGGGSVSEMAFALDSEQAAADFSSQFERGFGDVVAQTASDLAEQAPDSTPYAATVAIGCEGPESVAIDAGEAGFQVVAQVPKTTKQCLAPITYVVVFAAPNA